MKRTAADICRDWDRLVGLTCVCPPGCTTGATWGDGPRPCSKQCEPCTIMFNKQYEKPPKGGRKVK